MVTRGEVVTELMMLIEGEMHYSVPCLGVQPKVTLDLFLPYAACIFPTLFADQVIAHEGSLAFLFEAALPSRQSLVPLIPSRPLHSPHRAAPRPAGCHIAIQKSPQPSALRTSRWPCNPGPLSFPFHQEQAVEEGELFGEISFFTESGASETITTVSVCRVMVLSREAWQGILHSHAAAAGVKKMLENLLVSTCTFGEAFTPRAMLMERVKDMVEMKVSPPFLLHTCSDEWSAP